MKDAISKTVKSKTIDTHFTKYMLAGTLNTGFWYLTFAILILLHVHYAVASFLATAACVLFSFKTVGKIVFKNSDNSLLFKYVGVYTLIYIINVICLKLLLQLKMNVFLADALQILPLAWLSFTLNRRYVFPKN